MRHVSSKVVLVIAALVSLLFFDVEDPSRPTAASLMMQALIENRFQFKFHREMKELPVYGYCQPGQSTDKLWP
jgi:uncharacterized protein (TIGR03435 family)